MLEPADGRGECGTGQTGSVGLTRVVVERRELRVRRVVGAGDDDHEGRHRADNDRVDERFEQGDDALLDGVLGLRRRVSDGRGTHTGFVRERRTLEALDQHTDQATVGGVRCEG